MMFLRFRLRTLLLVTAVLAVCLAWYTDWRQTRQEIAIMTMGGSKAMEPFINGPEYLVVDLSAYRRARPARWEVVVFGLQPPSQAGQAPTASMLRVVGLPGEAISFSDGKVLINGQHLKPSPHVPPSGAVESIAHLEKAKYDFNQADGEVERPYVVPQGCYYLLGDNAEVASDSRTWGALPEAEILGRYPAHLSRPNRIWPVILVALLFSAVLGRLRRSWRLGNTNRVEESGSPESFAE